MIYSQFYTRNTISLNYNIDIKSNIGIKKGIDCNTSDLGKLIGATDEYNQFKYHYAIEHREFLQLNPAPVMADEAVHTLQYQKLQYITNLMNGALAKIVDLDKKGYVLLDDKKNRIFEEN